MKIINNNLKLLGYAFKYIPQFVVLNVFDNLFLGFLNSYFTVVFIKLIFDQIEEHADITAIFRNMLILLIIVIIGYIYHVLYLHVFENKYKYKLHDSIQAELFKKISKIELECFDDPQYYDDVVWVMNEADKQIFELVKDLGNVLNRVISIGTIFVLLSTVDWVVTFCVFASIIISLFIRGKQTKIEYESDKEIQAKERKLNYINKLYISKEYAKEIHSSDICSLIDAKLEGVISEENEILNRTGRKKFFVHFFFDFFTTTVFNVVILLLLLYKINVSKSISLGDFAASLGSSWKLFWQINSFTGVFIGLQKRNLYSEKFQTFMRDFDRGLACKTYREMPKENFEITFRNVSFRYPGTDKWILENINFQIKHGEKVAIVGYNGSGKTTMIRLIMRLYEPTKGQILLNGHNIKEYEITQYRAVFSTVFQNFKIYAFSVAENVLMREYNEDDYELVWNALHKCGLSLKIKEYSTGIKAVMKKEFTADGIELSGGQMQKIALARTFAKKSNIVIMDEPTSALDPISEYEMYKNILDFAQHKTCVFISHRLSITKDVDSIMYIEKGQIVENGSHEELLKINGRYAEMWKAQTMNIL